jgi:integrase/recombinase XerD
MDLYDPQGHDTGCLISEALAPTARSVDLSGKAIVFETLKKRRRGVYRAVTVPESMHDTLNMVPASPRPARGPHKCLKGLRHGYGVHVIGCGLPRNRNSLSGWATLRSR